VQVGTEVIVRFNLHDELEAGLQQQLYESAVRDPLTRAYNRKHFAERMRAELAHAAYVELDAGHWSLVERPVEAAAALDSFWAGT